VDLVFIHGLNGSPDSTWTADNSKLFWPKTLLPEELAEENVRILTFGYDADVAGRGGDGVSKDRIHNHAEHLLATLSANRRRARERPIIFVAHSLGGLIVKRALIQSKLIEGSKTEHLRSIYVSTYGILFMGTPHLGSDKANWGSYLQKFCGIVPNRILHTNTQLVEALKTNSEALINIERQFMTIIERVHLFYFHETKPTNFKGMLVWIVEEESAAPNLPDVERSGIDADHRHMAKFESSSSPGYEIVVDAIQRYSADAPASIHRAWAFEHKQREARAIELAQQYQPPQDNPSAPDNSASVVPTPSKLQALPPTQPSSSNWSLEFQAVEEPM